MDTTGIPLDLPQSKIRVTGFYFRVTVSYKKIESCLAVKQFLDDQSKYIGSDDRLSCRAGGRYESCRKGTFTLLSLLQRPVNGINTIKKDRNIYSNIIIY